MTVGARYCSEFCQLTRKTVRYFRTQSLYGNHRGDAKHPSSALKAIEQGAFAFFAKPADLNEVRVVLKRALLLSNLERESTALRTRIIQQSFEEIIGESPPMQRVFAAICNVAGTGDARAISVKRRSNWESAAPRSTNSSIRSEKTTAVDRPARTGSKTERGRSDPPPLYPRRDLTISAGRGPARDYSTPTMRLRRSRRYGYGWLR